MVRRMLKAGIAQSKALQYEQRALLVTMSEDVISSTDVGVLKFVLQSTRADAQAIQKCIRELWCATLNSDSESMLTVWVCVICLLARVFMDPHLFACLYILVHVCICT